MNAFERMRLIVSETLNSPWKDSYVVSRNGKGLALKSHGDYEGLDLSNLDLKGAHLEGANLQNALLRNTNLAGAYLDGANMAGADLTGAILAGTHLANARIDAEGLKMARFDIPPVGIDSGPGGIGGEIGVNP